VTEQRLLYRSKDGRGNEVLICTRRIFEAKGWETCISHKAYGQGSTIQAGVAVTYNKAARMHANWIRILTMELPSTITEVGIGGYGWHTGEVIYTRNKKLYPDNPETELVCAFCQRGMITDHDTWHKYNERWYHQDCLSYYLMPKED